MVGLPLIFEGPPVPPRVFHPIGFCTKHGAFAVTGIHMGGGVQTFIHCTTNCPTCGSQSEIIPGRYETNTGRLNLLIDPSISPQALVDRI
jgi:hypothetical protein